MRVLTIHLSPLIFLAACSTSTSDPAPETEVQNRNIEILAKPDLNPDAGEGQRAPQEAKAYEKQEQSAKATAQEGSINRSMLIEMLASGPSNDTHSSFRLGGSDVSSGSIVGTKRGKSGGIALRSRGGKPTKPQVSRGLRLADVPVTYNRKLDNQDEHQDHGINPFINPQKDKLSTFSIDVDTASYTFGRRRLQQGVLPNMASVRAEEYINHVKYDYAAPKNQPFAVHMESMPDPFQNNEHVLRIGVQGKKVSKKKRPPLRLTFLVDVSGSMRSESKLPLAMESMHLLTDSLRDDDSVAIVTYAGRVETILPATYGDNRRAIHKAIDKLTVGGGTAMSSGMNLAYKQAWKTFKKGAENRVVVLSDGDANIGKTSWKDMLKQIKGYADRGITMSTIGFGMGNYKDTRMEQLANKGDGNNFYVDSSKQAKRLFVQGFNENMITIARDVKIQVEFNPKSVKSYRLIGYENRDIADKDFRNDRVDAGEVGAGHSVTAVYKIIPQNNHSLKEHVAVVRLRYEAPGADKAAKERAWSFTAADMGASNQKASKSLRLAYSVASFAEVLRRSPYAANIHLDKLHKFASKAARTGNEDDRELLSLIKQAQQLKGQRTSALHK